MTTYYLILCLMRSSIREKLWIYFTTRLFIYCHIIITAGRISYQASAVYVVKLTCMLVIILNIGFCIKRFIKQTDWSAAASGTNGHLSWPFVWSTKKNPESAGIQGSQLSSFECKRDLASLIPSVAKSDAWFLSRISAFSRGWRKFESGTNGHSL